MPITNIKPFFALVLALAGCKGERSVASVAVPRPASPTAEAPSSPITVKWIEGSRNEAGSRLTLEVTKLIVTERPLALGFSVPPGVVVEPELTAREIAAASVGTTSIEVLVRTSVPPTQDLIAICDSQGTSFGFHAEVPYRFGRQAPAVAEPRLGEPVQIGPGQIRPVQLAK